MMSLKGRGFRTRPRLYQTFRPEALALTTHPYSRRPRSMDEMATLRARFNGKESHERGLAYQPSADEVLIATFPKCGTTWLQQIIHALRTNGSMDFGEITEVVPWLEMAHAIGMDPLASQVAAPRAFKTHLRYDEIPKGGRYIHVCRDPGDVLVSLYHFMEGWFFEPGTIGIDEFADQRFFSSAGRGGGYWGYLMSWWPHRYDENVLFMTYEDMQAEPAVAIRRIAEFIQCPLDAALEAVVLERSSFSFMKAHESHFDDHVVRAVLDRACNLEPGGDSSKVRSGEVGAAKATLSDEIRRRLDSTWKDVIETETGLATYGALRDALATGQ